MTSFDFQPRTRVIFGAGALARLGELARELGFRRTLLVADAGVVQAGYVAAAVRRARGRRDRRRSRSTTSARIPTPRWSKPAGRLRRRSAIDSLIGLGGGSSLDCAKGINFLLTNGGTMADYRGYGKATTPLLPMIGVPTTAGTGSEAQSYAVISDASTHMKMACGDPSAAVKIAILDPELTMSAPGRVTAMAGYDAIAHAVETWVTIAPDAALGHVLAAGLGSAERGVRTRADAPRRSRCARRRCSLGSHFAGIAIEQSMLGAAHACSNPLTARYDLAHGLALVDPASARRPLERAGSVASATRRSLNQHDAADGAEQLADRLERFARAGGLGGTLRDHGVPADALPELADLAAEQWTGTFNPRPFDAAGALEIYRAAY